MTSPALPAHVIGIMSGTSMDGIDAVLLALDEDDGVRIVDTDSTPFAPALRRALRTVARRRIAAPGEAPALDRALGQLYGEAAARLGARHPDRAVAVVGCHGQTVHHSPGSEPPFSVQLGDGATIAAACGRAVVTDFRRADLAAGGQGAPLAPGFHQAVFASPAENRCIVNIGGIANLTLLPAGGAVTGYDTGPGNVLLDGWCRAHFDCPFDRDGALARAGRVRPDLLALLGDDPYFAAGAPKSTGFEHFNASWLDARLARWTGRPADAHHDVLATLTALTAHTIAAALARAQPAVDAVYLCGGGARNGLLCAFLRERVDARVDTTAALGIDPQWVEAAAFGWMAWRTVRGLPSTLPAVTGARTPTVAGTVHRPDGAGGQPV